MLHHFSKFLKFLIKAGLTSGLGIRSLFSDRIKHFLRKNEQMSDSLKKNVQFAHSLISGEQPKRIAHSCSFLVSDLSGSLKLLTKKEGMSKSFVF